MEYQLRRFRIATGKLNEFIDAWKAGVVPLRERFGFQIHGAWSLEESDEFVWVLSYNGPEGFDAADAAYYASQERRRLSPDPAEHIASVEKASAHRVI
jgi:hypothetical protein